MGLFILALLSGYAAPGQGIWKRVDADYAARNTSTAHTPKYTLFIADEAALTAALSAIPTDPASQTLIELPMPDGTASAFKLWRCDLIPATLAAKYPELRTYSAVALNDPRITAKLDVTTYGFHAMIYNGEQTSFVDPADNDHTGYYAVHYKRDEQRQPGDEQACLAKTDASGREEQSMRLAQKTTAAVSNGTELRTYRLALACDHQYADSATGIVNPTIAQTLSKMVTSLNRVNGVLEREVAVTLVLVANEDTLIWTGDSTINGKDPFSAINDYASTCNNENQIICDARIGNSNYDVGHVFTTGAGGQSEVGCVCQFGAKAKSSTGRPHPVGDGFDIDFVVHEIGHELGANHSFNNGFNGSCAMDNRYQPTAYEPGSGSTIMAYAGICSPDDIQPHSDDYFHAVSLMEIQSYITGIGDGCAVKTPTGNKPPSIPVFTKWYNIPYLTPFELMAPAVTDSTANSGISYCWEEWDIGVDDGAANHGNDLKGTTDIGPIFRSYAPVSTQLRVFPNISMVLAGVLSNAGKDDSEGEKVPEVERYLRFKLTVRDLYQGHGAFIVAGDSINIEAVYTGAGFTVTSQNTTPIIYNGGSTQNITWNNVGSDKPPVNSPNVDIYMSADDGHTWPYHIGQYLNNGSAVVTLPNPDTTVTTARIKVKGADNVFFNVNTKPFTVVHSSAGDTLITLHPVPVRNTLRVSSGNKGLLQSAVYNSVGQLVWRGEINGELDIPVNLWARGDYLIRFVDLKNQKTVKKFVVQ